METERFLRLRQIFDQALQVAEHERSAFLEYHCAGDPSLLDEARQLLAAHSAARAQSMGPAPTQQPAYLVGPYRLMQQLGEGGMGAVYLALRDDGAFRKYVALKLLRRDQVSEDLVRRFHQERQVLANLDHPNIARILDGGQTHEGLPYYVMEYVEGMSLDRYCDERKLGLEGRIALFRQLCQAVQYLHENLVIHRDLKPSNIMVTADGAVKLLDFGIAKMQLPAAANVDITGPFGRIMTPGYASPEQISGAPLTRVSDVYSLGVILYHMVTGRLPFADPAAKLDHDPPVPSANIREDIQRTAETTAKLRRRIVGDFDNIVLRCLRTNPKHRYQTAAEISEDLQRFLEGKSVLARQAPITERAAKFVNRNRIPVAVAMLVLLLGGFGTWQAVEAQMQTRRAEAREGEIARLLDSLDRASDKGQPSARLDSVRRLRRALEQDFTAAWSAKPGFTQQRQTLLDRGVRYLDSVRPYAAQDPMLASELAGAYQQVGVLYEPGYRDYALRAFNNAAIVLNGASGGDPSQGQYRAQWLFLAGRIRGLGGSVPVYLSAPIGGSEAPKPSRPGYNNPLPPQERTRDTEPTETRAVAVPEPAAVVIAPADRAAYEELRGKLIDVTAKAATVAETMNQLEENSRRIGQLVHPDIRANHTRMKIALEVARKELERGSIAGARENLEIAEACANRVLKSGGR
ncbi:MAG: serine/threonine-protein kinase [Bryobacteraceae bacterium]